MKYLVLIGFIVSGCVSNSGYTFCDGYKIQTINQSDSQEVRMKKLSENTDYQRVCRG